MDKQERDLRARTAGTDVEVTRRGDDLVLNMPAGITFAYDSANVQPQFRSTLDQVADVLRENVDQLRGAVQAREDARHPRQPPPPASA